MQTVDPLVYSELEEIARERGIMVQELIRAIIIPEWLRRLKNPQGKPVDHASDSVVASSSV
jgi:hypothetical protein